jgi:anti-anti-sigma factor
VMPDGSDHARMTTGAGSPIVVVTLPGEIDITNESHVRDALAGALRSGAAVLVADATATAFCDCAGVNALTSAHRQASAAGARLRLAASPAVVRVLQLTGAYQLLDIYLAMPAALEGKQPSLPEAPTPAPDAETGDHRGQQTRSPIPPPAEVARAAAASGSAVSRPVTSGRHGTRRPGLRPARR